MQTLPKVTIINKVVMTLESRELTATAVNRVGFLIVVVGKGLRTQKIKTRDVKYVGLNRDQTYFTVRTKWGENCYPYYQFHDAICWAKEYLGYVESSDDYLTVN